MHTMTEPRWHSLQSFLFNVRRLGFYGWLRCAAENTWIALTRRRDDG